MYSAFRKKPVYSVMEQRKRLNMMNAKSQRHRLKTHVRFQRCPLLRIGLERTVGEVFVLLPAPFRLHNRFVKQQLSAFRICVLQ